MPTKRNNHMGLYETIYDIDEVFLGELATL